MPDEDESQFPLPAVWDLQVESVCCHFDTKLLRRLRRFTRLCIPSPHHFRFRGFPVEYIMVLPETKKTKARGVPVVWSLLECCLATVQFCECHRVFQRCLRCSGWRHPGTKVWMPLHARSSTPIMAAGNHSCGKYHRRYVSVKNLKTRPELGWKIQIMARTQPKNSSLNRHRHQIQITYSI
jgi:hypothetical protein